MRGVKIKPVPEWNHSDGGPPGPGVMIRVGHDFIVVRHLDRFVEGLGRELADPATSGGYA